MPGRLTDSVPFARRRLRMRPNLRARLDSGAGFQRSRSSIRPGRSLQGATMSAPPTTAASARAVRSPTA